MGDHFPYSTNQDDKRIERKSDRLDIMKSILENNHAQGMTEGEIDSTVQLLILAGSETAATAMALVHLFLAHNRSRGE